MEETNVFTLKAKMESLWNEFSENHDVYAEKSTKAAAARARKAINELKKLVTEYKKLNMDHVKSI